MENLKNKLGELKGKFGQEVDGRKVLTAETAIQQGVVFHKILTNKTFVKTKEALFVIPFVSYKEGDKETIVLHTEEIRIASRSDRQEIRAEIVRLDREAFMLSELLV